MDNQGPKKVEVGKPPEMNRKQRRQMEHLAKKYRPRGKCPFPGCGKTFFVEEGKPNACPRHRELITDVVFIMNRTSGKPAVDGKVKGPTTDEGPLLYIPRPGMMDQAIKEAANAAKGGKRP